jgi:hypothetical protein
MEVYKAHVSGKPLEALELYWMGKMMKDMGKITMPLNSLKQPVLICMICRLQSKEI